MKYYFVRLRGGMYIRVGGTKESRYVKPLREFTIILLIMYCFLWNSGTTSVIGYTVDDPYRWVGQMLRLDQNWGMFAPTVFKDDGWFILAGVTSTNDTIDINRKGKALDYHKPESVVSLFANDRWRKYSENFLFISNTYMRPYYCNYILQRWNRNHEQKIHDLKVVYMKEVTQPDFKFVKPLREVLCDCR